MITTTLLRRLTLDINIGIINYPCAPRWFPSPICHKWFFYTQINISYWKWGITSSMFLQNKDRISYIYDIYEWKIK
jgi:hypothetical protein